MVFDVTKFSEDNILISIFDIKCINDELKQFIDKNFVQICYGKDYDPDDLSTVKLELKKRMKKWDKKSIIGSIAEFFVHLYLKSCGYSQESLFFNLEENSPKKGFDGLYTVDNELWFMESKSGTCSVKANHVYKVRKAYDDLKDKITTNVSNNPWSNAYNHAKLINPKGDIIDYLKKMKNDFINEKYQTIDDKNLIPCATIFFNGIWHEQNHYEIINSVKKLSTLKGKNFHIVCITQKSYEIFMEYLGN